MGLTYVPVVKTGGDITFKDLDVSGTLNVDGAVTLGSTLNVTGATTLNTAVIGGTLQVNGTSTLAGVQVTAPASMNTIDAAFTKMTSGQSDGNFSIFGQALVIGTAGGGVQIKEGANATMGVATLVTGSATVATTKVTANSRIFLTVQNLGTVSSPKAVAAFNRTPGTSFQIASSDATDTSVIAWHIIEPA